MRVIVGLGNPGEKYTLTRHNLGWQVVNALAEKLDAPWSQKGECEVAEASSKDSPATKGLSFSSGTVLMVRPMSYMNNSGSTLHQIIRQLPVELKDLWVVHDDADLPLGQIKVKQGGTSAGHHGIESIDQELGADYWRIRVGIGRGEGSLEEYVLRTFSSDEESRAEEAIDQTTEVLIKCINEGITNQTIQNG